MSEVQSTDYEGFRRPSDRKDDPERRFNRPRPSYRDGESNRRPETFAGGSSSVYSSPSYDDPSPARGPSPNPFVGQPLRYRHTPMAAVSAESEPRNYHPSSGVVMGYDEEQQRPGGPFDDERRVVEVEDPFLDNAASATPPPRSLSPPSRGVFVHEDGGSVRSFGMSGN